MKIFYLYAPIFLSLLSGSSCMAQNPTLAASDGEHSPVSRILTKEYPLVELSQCEKQGEKITLGSTLVEVGLDKIHIQGTARDGSKWSTQIPYDSVAAREIYRGDLGGKGDQDLAVVLFHLDSSGASDTELILLRFDEAGKPIPWRTAGAFHADKNGIAELFQDPQGNPLILDTVGTGHPGWDVPDVHILYRLKSGNLERVHGFYRGFDWPYLAKGDSGNAVVRKMLAKLDISQSLDTLNAPSVKTDSPLHVLSYRDDLPKHVAAAPAPLPPGTYPSVDMEAAEAAIPYLLYSDGSKSELPSVLVLDRADSSREILFDPDPDQISELWKKPFTVRRIGTQCSAQADCQPFLLLATAYAPKP